MSEPMTSVEIEDVLSSIRRLVAEDLRPAAAQPAPAAAPVPAKAPLVLTPALLLTPALRVPAKPEDPAAAPPRDSLAGVLKLVGEGDAMARDTQPDDLLPDPAEDAGLGVLPPIADLVNTLGAKVADDPSTEDWSQDLADGTARAWGAPNWEPEIVEVDLDRIEEAEVVEFTSPEEARLEEAWRDGAWPEDADLHAGMVADAPEAEAPAVEVDPELADLAEAAALAEIEAAEDRVAEATAAAAPGIFAPDAADDFDEEALREVVRDIIREELQGALGERITRNVRKLVRAEINRALATRDLG